MGFRVPADVRLARIASNPHSFLLVRRLIRAQSDAVDGSRVGAKIRPLRGETVWLRPGTSDARVVWETFDGLYHLPPKGLEAEAMGLIWDLGSNIGLTMAHMAVQYPHARILGVELDPGNARLAEANVVPWRERCNVMQAAVWTENGSIRYDGAAGMEYGFRVAAGTGSHMAPAISLNTILEGEGRAPDYVKMDIEGSERDVLRKNTEWAADVRAIKVEVHEPYSVAECVSDLQRLGFHVTVDRRHRACAVGVRL